MGTRGRQRDEEFARYVAARRQHLRRYAYLLCGDWHAAEDLVQTSLTKLYLAWPRIRREQTEEAYARKALMRCFLGERRRPWRRETASDSIPDRAATGGLSYEDVEELRAAVRSLPARQRAVLVLRHWWGLSIEETADDLGCSIGTVKSLGSRGAERLRSALSARSEPALTTPDPP